MRSHLSCPVFAAPVLLSAPIMSYCLNPYCGSPHNPDSDRFCSTCGFKLLLGDRYRAQTPIGQGGFGRTFLAVDEYKPSRPQCVIKQFLPQNAIHDRQQARELFRREAVQLERLGNHAQIPELLAYFEQADYQYLVQEFIDGQNLMQEVAQTGAFSDLQVWQLLKDLLPVLEFIHHYQVIHRDIKPQNILRRPHSQQYVLVDFGAAKSIQGTELARTGTSIGSPEFTPPEQAIGKATYASDLYSLGVTCIYLLTQTRPADLFDTGESAWLWRPHLPCPGNTVLGEILDKLLQAAVRRRYQSAAAVQQDLDCPKILAALAIAPASPLAAVPPENRTIAASPEDTRMPVTKPSGWICTHTLHGHQSWVRSVVLHPTGETLASGSGDRTVNFWQRETGEVVWSIPAHNSWVRAIAVSPDGGLLASGSNDRTVKLWQWGTGNLLRTLTGHTDWVRSVAFSADGRWLASSAQDRVIHLWEVATGKLVQTLRGHRHWVTTVAFLPTFASTQMPIVVSGSQDNKIRLWQWNWDGDETIAHLEGHTDAVNSIAVSANGQSLVSASDDGTVRIWDLATCKLRHCLKEHGGAVHGVAIAAEAQTLVSASQDKTIKLWDLSTGALTETLTGHANWVWSVAVSPDATTIVSGSWDNSVKLWQRV